MITSQRDINENVNIRQIRRRSLLSILKTFHWVTYITVMLFLMIRTILSHNFVYVAIIDEKCKCNIERYIIYVMTLDRATVEAPPPPFPRPVSTGNVLLEIEVSQ